MSHARLRRVGVLAAAATVAGLTAAPASSAPQAGTTDVRTTQALSANWYASAPYVMPLANDPPDITEVMDATGQRAFLLAFILADGGSCSPAWDGQFPVSSDTAVADVVNEIRANGGDVIVAAGGFAGTKLGQVCDSPEATAAAYQQVIDRYDLHAFDFDIEVPEIEQHGAVFNELAAARILQENNPGLYVSVTMPTLTSGANWHGVKLLEAARGVGLVPNAFTIMPFNGGFNGAQAQIGALEGFHDQLMQVFGWDSATAYARMGASLMNGRTDRAEFFPQSAFEAVLDYAADVGLGRYTYWSVNRDRECDPPDIGRTLGTCSSVPQELWEFTEFTTRFAAIAPTEPPTPPEPEPCSAPAWNPATTYVGGDQVTHEGHTFEAKWWNRGAEPGSRAVWADLGPCA